MVEIGELLPTPDEGWKRIEDNNSAFGYIGYWASSSSNSNYSGSYMHYSKGSDTLDNTKYYVSFSFTGTKLAVLFAIASTYSDNISLEIDGDIHIVNCKGENTTGGTGCVLAYVTEDLSNTIHNVRIFSNDENSFAIDAIDIDKDATILPGLGVKLTTPQSGMKRYSATNLNINYNGEFSNYSGIKTSTTIGDSYTFYFYGSRLAILEGVGSNRSDNCKVTIDDDIVSWYSAYNQSMNVNSACIVYVNDNLKEEVHKVTVTNRSTMARSKQFGVLNIDVDGYLCTSDGKFIDVTPCMTSNTAPAPYNITSSGVYSSQFVNYRAFNGILNTTDITECWASTKNDPNPWITIDFGQRTLFNSFDFYTRYFDSNDCYAKKFTIYGSNDGIEFTKLEQFEQIYWEKNTKYRFRFSNTYKYRYVKLAVDEITILDSASYWFTIGELRYLLDANSPYYLIAVDDDEGNSTYSTIIDDELVETNLDTLLEPALINRSIRSLNNVIDHLDELADFKWSLISNKSNPLIIEGIKSTKEMVVSLAPAFLSIANNIKFIKANIDEYFNSELKIIFSIDNNWYTYKDDAFTLIDIDIPTTPFDGLTEEERNRWEIAKDVLYNEGIDYTEFETLNFNEFGSIDIMKIAFVINTDDYNKISKINSIDWQYDGKGYYRLLQEGTDIEIRQNEDLLFVKPLKDLSKILVNIKNGEITNSNVITRYDQLTGLPYINGVKVKGSMTLEQLNIASKTNLNKINDNVVILERKIAQLTNIGAVQDVLDSYALLLDKISNEDIADGTTFIIKADENFDGTPTTMYLYTKINGPKIIGQWNITIRDFSIDKLDLDKEVTGKLSKDNIDGLDDIVTSEQLDNKQDKIDSLTTIINIESFTEDTTTGLYYYDCTHNLNTTSPLIKAYNSDGEIIIGVTENQANSCRLWIIEPESITVKFINL